MKICTRCKENKSKSEFFKDCTKKDGLTPQCKTCKMIRCSEYIKSPRGKEANKKYKESTKGKKVHYEYTSRVKNKVLTHYSLCGFPRCSSPGCGITDIDMLCIDHINDNGNIHRKELGKGGSVLYQWLVQNKYPDGYQVLCFNHNMKKEILRKRICYAS